MSAQDNNGRKNHRLTVDIPVKIRYNGITVPGKSANLSCGGIFIRTPVSLPEKGKFEVEIPLPDGRKPMEISSELVWQKNTEGDAVEEDQNELAAMTVEEPVESSEFDESGGGFRFNSLNPEEKERLAQFLRRLMRHDTH